MMPVLPFLAGLMAGAMVVKSLRSEKARTAMNDAGARLRTVYDEAESGVRAATRAGLDRLRGAKAGAEPAAEPAAAAPAAAPKKPRPARKPAVRAKPATAQSAATKPAEAKPARAPRKAKAVKAED
ncbi:MAG: hypothetical protein PHS77_07240 [Gallionellaceae bacterium]|nr:hypothetical protein [Gallionellaceae bacterium]